MLKKIFLKTKRFPSSSAIQQVPTETWTLRKADFLRKAIEQGLITEAEAHFLATRPMLLTILSPDLCAMSSAQVEKQVRLSELVKKELYGQLDPIDPPPGPLHQ